MNLINKIDRVAHWRLNRREADDIVRDYREFFSDSISDGKEISCNYTVVRQSIKSMGDKKQYWIWMTMFSLMLFSLISIVSLLFSREYYLGPILCLFMFGLGLSTFYFLFTDQTKLCKQIPPKLFLSLFVLLILSMIVCMYIWFNIQVAPKFLDSSIRGWLGQSVTWLVQIVGVVAGGTGIFGLYMAKVYDRRWRAVYSAGLTISVSGVFLLSYLHTYDLLNLNLWTLYCICGCVVMGIGGIGVSFK